MMFMFILVLVAVVLGLGIALVFGKAQIPAEKEKQVMFSVMTAGIILSLLAFLVPHAKPPEWLLRMKEKATA